VNTHKWPQLLTAAGLAAIAAAAVTVQAPAHASCISISGFGNGNGTNGSYCVSGPLGIAIGIGPNTFATSDGLFTAAVAVGLLNGPTDTSQASSTGFLSLAAAVGTNVSAGTQGRFGLAVAQGRGNMPGNAVVAQAGLTPTDNLNVAINVLARSGTGVNRVLAVGDANLAANIGGDSTNTRDHVVQAFGLGNIALNGFGDGNQVSAGNLTPGATDAGVPPQTRSTFGLAFNTLGHDNTVTAIGPLAFAGSILGSNRNDVNRVLQIGPGIALNRNRIGSTTSAATTAAPQPSSPAKGFGAKVAAAINKSLAGVAKSLHLPGPE
jgi:hypothetical protein